VSDRAAWIGFAVTWGLQIIFFAYISGMLKERFDALLRWRDDEAKPQLEDHEDRIVDLEGWRREVSHERRR
jgi:hypothetical protein